MRTLSFKLQEAGGRELLAPESWLIFFASEPDVSNMELLRIGIEGVSDIDVLLSNEEPIRTGLLPAFLDASLPIAHAIREFLEECDPEVDEVQMEYLYQYRLMHGLRFTFRGQDIPDVYIGLRGGFHEISCHDGGVDFDIRVDLERLFGDMRHIREVVSGGAST